MITRHLRGEQVPADWFSAKRSAAVVEFGGDCESRLDDGYRVLTLLRGPCAILVRGLTIISAETIAFSPPLHIEFKPQGAADKVRP